MVICRANKSNKETHNLVAYLRGWLCCWSAPETISGLWPLSLDLKSVVYHALPANNDKWFVCIKSLRKGLLFFHSLKWCMRFQIVRRVKFFVGICLSIHFHIHCLSDPLDNYGVIDPIWQMRKQSLKEIKSSDYCHLSSKYNTQKENQGFWLIVLCVFAFSLHLVT